MSRSGSATLLVMFLTAALMLIGSALWRGAGVNLADAQSNAATLQARLAAEAAVSRTIAAGGALPQVAAGASHALPGFVLVAGTPGVRSAVAALRVTPELYRIEATGTAGRPAAVAKVAYLLWQLDPGSRLRAMRAVAKIGGAVRVGSGGAVLGLGVTTPPTPWTPSECFTAQSLADSVFPSGSVPASVHDTTPPLTLGLLDQTALLTRGRLVLIGGTPTPQTLGGTCITADPWNWGSPISPTGPCGAHRPLTTASGDLLVSGGEGQGVLVVDGNLRLTAGAQYFGIVMATGDVTLDQGAQLHGFVRAGGDVVVGPSSSARGSACAALLALETATLRSPIPVSAGWLDPF